MSLSKDEIFKIEDKTEEILDAFYGQSKIIPPVDLYKILAKNKLELEYGDFGNPEVLGALFRDERKIVVQYDTSLKRQLFTIAHELGHYSLHKHKEKDVYLRDVANLDDPTIKKEEQEANWFAASLLMPKNAFMFFYRYNPSITFLSETFQVSQSAAFYRLQNIQALV